MGQRQAKDNLREALGELMSYSPPSAYDFSERLTKLPFKVGKRYSIDDYLEKYEEKSVKVLTLRKKLLQSASSVDINSEFRRLLFEAAVTAQQMMELAVTLRMPLEAFEKSLTRYTSRFSIGYFKKKKQEKTKERRKIIRDKIQEFYMELTKPEQLADALEFLRTSADGLLVKFLVRHLLASSKTFTTLTSAELLWLKQVARSVAAANVILCGEYTHIELESHTSLDESEMLSYDLIYALEAVRPAILPMCRNRAHQLMPLLQVGRTWYIL
jgi:hypothetical protein